MAGAIDWRKIVHRKAAWKPLAARWLGVAMLAAGATLGYAAALNSQGRTAETPAFAPNEIHRLRQQVAVLTANESSLQAELADTRERLGGCRRTIRRFEEELAHVDRLNATRQGDGN